MLADNLILKINSLFSLGSCIELIKDQCVSVNDSDYIFNTSSLFWYYDMTIDIFYT